MAAFFFEHYSCRATPTQMKDNLMFEVIIGLIPACVLRWAVNRKQLSRAKAIGVCVLIWFGAYAAFQFLGYSESWMPPRLAALVVFSFIILRAQGDETQKDEGQPDIFDGEPDGDDADPE